MEHVRCQLRFSPILRDPSASLLFFRGLSCDENRGDAERLRKDAICLWKCIPAQRESSSYVDFDGG
jgi:hypothetical protein